MSELQRVPKAEWHVLVVDDDDDYALIIERALRAAAGVLVLGVLITLYIFAKVSGAF